MRKKGLAVIFVLSLLLAGCRHVPSPIQPPPESLPTEPTVAPEETAEAFTPEEIQWLEAPCPDTALTGFTLEKTVFDLTATGLDTDFAPGFDLTRQVTLISAEAFSGQIQEVPEIIRYQFENRDLFSSSGPGWVSREFDSSGAAISYLGYEPLHFPKWDAWETSASVSITGNRDGSIQSVTLQVQYLQDDLRMQAFATMYTEHYSDTGSSCSITSRVHTNPDMAEHEFVYETSGGKHCLILRSLPTETGYYGIDGYYLDGGTEYNLHVIYREGQYEQAKAMLCEWLNLL